MSGYHIEQDKINNHKTDSILDGLYHDERKGYSFTDWINSMRDEEMASNTVYAYACELHRFASYLASVEHLESIYDVDVEVLDRQKAIDIQRYMTYLRENGVAESGRARSLSALRTVYQYYVDHGIISQNSPRLVNIPKIHIKQKNRLEKEELEELLRGVATADVLPDRQKKIILNSTNSRDIAIIKTLSGTGIRVSELVGLDLTDINFKHGKLLVTRKGGDQEYVDMGEKVNDAIKEYVLSERTKNYYSTGKSEEEMIKEMLRDAQKDNKLAVFLSSRGEKGRLTVRSVERLVSKYSKATNIANVVSPHGLRRTYGSTLIEVASLDEVSKALGHKNIQVTKDHYVVRTKSNSDKLKTFSDDLLS